MPENSKPLTAFRKGDVLTASKLNEVLDRVNRQRIDTGQSSGLAVQETERGTVLRVVATDTAGVFYAQYGSIIAAATGTWPNITAVSATVDVYQRTGSSLTKVETAAKIWNSMPDPTIANHRLILSLNPDGSYDIIGMSCSVGT